MMTMTARTWCLLLTGVLALVGPLPVAFAEISVTPGVQEVRVHPGEVLLGTWVFSNTESYPVTTQIEFENWSWDPAKRAMDVATWLSVEPKQFEVGPGQNRTVTFSATVDREKRIPLPPIVGVLALAGGVCWSSSALESPERACARDGMSECSGDACDPADVVSR